VGPLDTYAKSVRQNDTEVQVNAVRSELSLVQMEQAMKEGKCDKPIEADAKPQL
jgi:hypothetical protein